MILFYESMVYDIKILILIIYIESNFKKKRVSIDDTFLWQQGSLSNMLSKWERLPEEMAIMSHHLDAPHHKPLAPRTFRHILCSIALATCICMGHGAKGMLKKNR